MKVFPWADITSKKAAFKLHLGLDHDGLLPAFAEVTEGLSSEMEAVDTFDFPKGSVLVFDRGYSRYTWLKGLTKKELFWATRAKVNMKYEVIKSFSARENSVVASDQLIRLVTRKR